MGTKAYYLNWFTSEEDFPFFIQYGAHKENLCTHVHADFAELVIVLSGTAIHIVDDEEYPIKKGDVFVISDRTAHGYKNPENFKICNIMFRMSYFADTFRDLRFSPGFQALFIVEPTLTRSESFKRCLRLSLHQYQEVQEIITELLKEYKEKSPCHQAMIVGSLLRLFVKLSRYYESCVPMKNDNVISMANAIVHIENHFTEDISVEDLAKLAGISSRHFRRIFHSIYEISPAKYITILRIQCAIRLLSETSIPVTEVAIRSGFSDSNYFSRKFKSETGKSPLEYRQHIATLS